MIRSQDAEAGFYSVIEGIDNWDTRRDICKKQLRVLVVRESGPEFSIPKSRVWSEVAGPCGELFRGSAADHRPPFITISAFNQLGKEIFLTEWERHLEGSVSPNSIFTLVVSITTQISNQIYTMFFFIIVF